MTGRRSFLKTIGQAALAVVATPVAFAASPPTTLGITRVVSMSYIEEPDDGRCTMTLKIVLEVHRPSHLQG